MSGIRFCSECLNILHPEEAKNEHRLVFVCKSCDYREFIQDMNSMEENKIYQRDFIQSFTEAFIDPDFCLDPSMPRENIICPNCRYPECAFMIDREPGDKYLRKVYICSRVGKSGKPECKNVFTAVKYLKMQDADKLPKAETYAYREYGANNSKVLILLHGNYTSSYVFERTFGKLAEAFRVIAPDMRGFGLSSYSTSLKSFDDLANDLSVFLHELKVSKCSVLGWDIGALVAMKFASMYPGNLDKLVLVNPVGIQGKTYIKDPYLEENTMPEWPDNIEEATNDIRMKDLDAALRKRDKEFLKEFYCKEFYTHQVPENERLTSYIEHFLHQNNLKEITNCLINYDISTDGTAEIHNIQNETLILCGKDDLRTPYTDGIEIKKNLGQNASVKIFEDAGHCLMEDAFEDFIKAVGEFCYYDES